jgi:hypothetical protein
MQLTIIGIATGRLPAFIMDTTVDLHHLRFVLSEIETFSRMDFTTDSQLKVFIRYFSILIQVKFVKEILELFVSEVETPVLKVKAQFLGQNCSCFLHVEIHKCLSESLPLKLNLVQHCFFKVVTDKAVLGIPLLLRIVDLFLLL